MGESMATSKNGLVRENDTVSLKLSAGEEASAVAEAVTETQPEARITDHRAYVSIDAPGALEIDVAKVSEVLGRPYDVPTFLVILSSYVGSIDIQDDRVRVTSDLNLK